MLSSYDRGMKKPSIWRQLVGREDLLLPTRRRWLLLAVGLLLALGPGFLLGLAAPDREDLAGIVDRD